LPLRLACGAVGPVAAWRHHAGRQPWQALGVEVLLTAALMFVITAMATDTRAAGHSAALAIGGAVALNSLWGGP